MRARHKTLRFGAVLLGVNIFLTGIKAVALVYTGSLAVQAELINSLADVIHSLIVVTGLYVATRPATKTYPDGYRRLEPFLSLFVGGAIIVTGAAVAWNAATTLTNPGPIVQSEIAIGVLLVTALLKYQLYRVTYQYGEEVGSPAMKATAVDNKHDVFTAGAALIGVGGGTVGLPVLDPIAAGLVAIAITYAGYEIIRENLGYILARAPDEQLRGEITEAATNHPEVHGIHDVCIYHGGPEIDVSMHIEVEGGMSVEDAHEIEVDVADDIREQSTGAIDEINLHVDPDTLGEWRDKYDTLDESELISKKRK